VLEWIETRNLIIWKKCCVFSQEVGEISTYLGFFDPTKKSVRCIDKINDKNDVNNGIA